MFTERPKLGTPHDKLVRLLREHTIDELQARIRDPEIKAELARYVARRAETGAPSGHIASQTSVTSM
jgi:hypothetical protein